MRAVVIMLAFLVLATSCQATATARPVDSTETAFGGASQAEVAAPSQQDGALDVTFTFDPRINPRLVRQDIDCSPAAFNGYENGRIVSAYYVVDGQLGANCFGQENVLLVEAWKVLVSTAPASHLAPLGLFTGYINELDVPADLSAIGLASDLGWTSNAARISVDLDRAFADVAALSLILTHEMAHVLSGARSQTTPDNESSCQAFFFRRCFQADALFVEFAALFWLDYLPDFDYRTGPSPEKGRFRCERDGGFFNAYAASDPFEDFAESYTRFVHGYDAATPGQQARLDWFANKPALAAARDRASVLRPEFGRRIFWEQCGR